MAGRFSRLHIVLGLLLLLAVGLAGLMAVANARYSQLDQALQVMAHVKMRYVETAPLADLFRAYLRTGTIDGMLASLGDPYTRFLPPTEYRELRVQTNGTFGGIGVILNYHEQDKTILIMKALSGSPGETAGLTRGDRILAINGRPTKEMSVDEAVAAIRGPAGSAVRLTIIRGEKGAASKTWDVKITRANIKLPSVEWEIVNDAKAGKIAFITLSQFSERTTAELEEALQAADLARVKGVILDLRYNPGGLLDAAIGVASKFLDGGTVMYMLKRNGIRQPFLAEPQATRRHYPLVLLVNQWSASAAEIVAGALKDRHAATLVGAKTFGKGVVQEVVPLSRGAALSVTVARYLTAGGRSINKIGIEPDEEVDIPGVMDRAMQGGKLDELLRLERMQRDRAFEILRARAAKPAAAAS